MDQRLSEARTQENYKQDHVGLSTVSIKQKENNK